MKISSSKIEVVKVVKSGKIPVFTNLNDRKKGGLCHLSLSDFGTKSSARWTEKNTKSCVLYLLFGNAARISASLKTVLIDFISAYFLRAIAASVIPAIGVPDLFISRPSTTDNPWLPRGNVGGGCFFIQ